MSVSFFNSGCSEPQPRTEIEFGLCDDGNNTKACSNTDKPEKWIATVKNENNIAVTITAIDNCISISNTDGTQSKRCDLMLTYSQTVYLVELKGKGKDWITDAVEQLEATIKAFLTTPESRNYIMKKAFASNRRHPYFHTINDEVNKRMFMDYGFRIDIQAEIVIK